MIYRGLVTTKRVSIGSKSERDAVVLTADEGEFILRRIGGNPFNDEALNAIVGSRVEIEGTLEDRVLRFDEYKTIA